MTREEITNSQDYKVTKAALEWWYSLPEEQRKATDIDAEPDIVDAYAEGVVYGWSYPQWIPVEERLPKENEEVLAYNAENEEVIACDYHHKMFHCWPEAFSKSITHWMPLPPVPRKED